ncbi:MAG: flagellar filament outer layer protein FlaA [bacterium]|nr:flagellar filament outer layer protein FlaA [bacterium]
MKMKCVLSVLFIMFFTMSLAGQTDYQNIKLKFVTPLDYQRWVLVDDFEFSKINNWDLNASSQKSSEQKSESTELKAYFKKTEPSLVFSSLKTGRFLMDNYKDNSSCLGVKVSFPELIRASVFLKAKQSYQMDGYCKKIALWVLGRGRNVDFELILKDYLGRNYPVFVSKLDFLGWKYCEVSIPSYIPQNYDLYPQRKVIELAGFQVTCIPSQFADEQHKTFYVYIDQVEALLDQYAKTYPGLEISDEW